MIMIELKTIMLCGGACQMVAMQATLNDRTINLSLTNAAYFQSYMSIDLLVRVLPRPEERVVPLQGAQDRCKAGREAARPAF